MYLNDELLMQEEENLNRFKQEVNELLDQKENLTKDVYNAKMFKMINRRNLESKKLFKSSSIKKAHLKKQSN